jgi:hypothetical protein
MPNLIYPYSIVAGDVPIAARVQGNFDAIKTLLESTGLGADNLQNDSVGLDELAADVEAVLAELGANVGGSTRRGRTAIATEESRTNTAYGLLGTADKITAIEVPQGATVRLDYGALWKESVAGAARAAIFCKKSGGSDTQLKIRTMTDAAPVPEAALVDAVGANTYRALQSFEAGLCAIHTPSVTHSSDVTTGQADAIAATVQSGGTGYSGSLNRPGVAIEVNGAKVVLNAAPGGTDEVLPAVFGGTCPIKKLAAGTYDFSVQFKAMSGSVTVKERELKVSVEGF